MREKFFACSVTFLIDYKVGGRLIEFETDPLVTKKLFEPNSSKDKFLLGQSKQPCHVGNTCSHLNNQVKQHWTWIVLGWETGWELPVLLAWVWKLMLLIGNWTVLIRGPLVDVTLRLSIKKWYNPWGLNKF